MQQQQASDRFESLDGIRGLGAFFIVFAHALDQSLRALLPSAHLAVDLFFTLSGFVLAHVYLDRLKSGKMNAQTFIAIRIGRLYPLYIFSALIFALLVFTRMLLGEDISTTAFIGTLATAILFLPTPSPISTWPDMFYPLNFPSWSLFFELFINLVLLVVATRLTRSLLAGLIAVGVLMVSLTVLRFENLNVGVLWEFGNWIGGFSRITVAFFVGVAAYWVWRSKRFAWFKIPSALPILILGLVCIVPLWGVKRMVFDVFVVSVGWPLLVLGTANAQIKGLYMRACLTAGAASYALYMLHVPVMRWLQLLSDRLLHIDYVSFGLAGTLFMATMSFGLAVLVDKYYDAPARSWLTKTLRALRLPSRNRQPASTPASGA